MSTAARALTGRPLPVQAPTAFVRIRPRGRLCGEARSGRGGVALIRVGSRGSRLALTQAELAADALRGVAVARVEIALVPITTAGDRDRTRPFGEIGSRGVFVKELEEALLDGRIDVAVHSAKDMTSTDTDGLAVGAYLPREDPRDALCGASGLAPGMRVGTASVRRRAQLLALEPTLVDRAAAREHRHAPAQARGARARRDRPRCVPGSTGSASAPRSAIASTRQELLPEAGQGALALQVRAGDEELVAARRRPGDAPPRRGGARVRRRDRRRVPRAGRRVPRRHDRSAALVAAEDGSWVERLAGDDPVELGRALVDLESARSRHEAVTDT